MSNNKPNFNVTALSSLSLSPADWGIFSPKPLNGRAQTLTVKHFSIFFVLTDLSTLIRLQCLSVSYIFNLGFRPCQ